MLSNKRKQSAPKSKPSKACNLCEYQTNEMQELIDHVKLDHNKDEIYPCDHCNFYTYSLWNFQVHIAGHIEKKQNCDENNLKIKIDKLKIGKAQAQVHHEEGEDEDEDIKNSVSSDMDDQYVKDFKNNDDDNDDDDNQNLQHENKYNAYEQTEQNDDEDDLNETNLSIKDQMDDNDDYDDEPLQEFNNQTQKQKQQDLIQQIQKVQTHNYKIDNYTNNNNHKKTQLQATSTSSQAQNSMSIVLPVSHHHNHNHNLNQHHQPQEQQLQIQQQQRAKRHYNSEVDPARYRKVLEDGITKFACSLCGNTYKWRKSLNKHWKEKHITEQPPPLDAPVTIKLRNSNTTITSSASNKIITQQPLLASAVSTTTSSVQIPSTTNTNTTTTTNTPASIMQPNFAQKLPMPDQATTALLLQYAAAYCGQFMPQHQHQQQQQKQQQPSINQPKITPQKCHDSFSSEPLDLTVSNSKPKSVSSSSVSSVASSISVKQEPIMQINENSSGHTSRRSSMSSSNEDHHHNHHQQQQANAQNRKQLCGASANTSVTSAGNAYNQKLYVCSVCEAKFHVVDHINDHFFKNHYIEYQRELSSKSPPRNTNVAQQNEEWRLSDPLNPLKCVKCDFVGRWPTELQKHAASHSTSRPFKCLICSLTYKWRWDLAKHFDRTHPTFRNPYKKRDRDAARSTLLPNGTKQTANSKNNGIDSAGSSNTPTSSSTSVHTTHTTQTRDQSPPSCSSSPSLHARSPPSSQASFEMKPHKHQQQQHELQQQQQQQQYQKPLAVKQPPTIFPNLPHGLPFGSDAASMYAAMMPFFAAHASNSFAQPQQHMMPNFFLQAAANFNKNPSAQMPYELPKVAKSLQPTASSTSSDDVKLTSSNSCKKLKLNNTEACDVSRESRNFQCYWCDFRGRWRSEIIQHMRCHHAREKPYRCSACSYASNWKWDVQKHTKKQHTNDITAKIIEIPDSVLFPDLKDWNFFDTQQTQSQSNIKQVNGSTSGSSTSSSECLPKINKSHSTSSVCIIRPPKQLPQQEASAALIKNEQSHNLACQQCPYTACNLSDLRRHLIVHSNEQPYHCCSCDFKSKWKSDVKKHQRILNHIGPILVGKKAMQKVIENLGLDRNSIVNLYGPNIQIIDNKQCKSNEKLIDEEDTLVNDGDVYLSERNKRKRVEAENDDGEVYAADDDDEEEEYQQILDDSDDEEELVDEDYFENAHDYNMNEDDNGTSANSFNHKKTHHTENLSDDDDDDHDDDKNSNFEHGHEQREENDEHQDEEMDDYHYENDE